MALPMASFGPLWTQQPVPPGMVPPGPRLYAREQRGISLATGFITWESTQIHLAELLTSKYININFIHNHDFGMVDSVAKSTCSNPPGQIQSAKQRQNWEWTRNGPVYRTGRDRDMAPRTALLQKSREGFIL